MICIYQQQKRGLLLHRCGTDIKTIYKTLRKTIHNYDDIVRKLNPHFGTKKNITHESFTFKQVQQNGEKGTASYVTRLRTLADTCDFANSAEEIRDHFVSSRYSRSVKEKLLRITDLTLEKCLETGESRRWRRNKQTEVSEQNKATISTALISLKRNRPTKRKPALTLIF